MTSTLGVTCPGSNSELHSSPVLYPDLLFLIFENLNPLDELDRATCAAGALVCSSWSEPACAALWAQLDSPCLLYHIIFPLPQRLQKIFRPACRPQPHQLPDPGLVPDALFNAKLMLTTSYFDNLKAVQKDLISQDKVWQRFLQCAGRVRKIGQWEAAGNEVDLLRLLLERNGNTTFLPCLRTMHWNEGVKCKGLLVALTPPSLRELTLSFHTTSMGLTNQLYPTLSQLAVKAPSLHCLEIIPHPRLAPLHAAPALPEFKTLRHLRTSVEPSSFMLPPTLTTLRCIVDKFERCQGAYHASALRKLLAQGHAPEVAGFMSSLHAPCIEHLYLVIMPRRNASGQAEINVVNAVARSACANYLREFTMNMSGATCVMDHIRPLFSLSGLRRVEIRAQTASYVDEDILFLARSWPNLEELVLNPSTEFLPRPYPRPTLASLAHIARHCRRLKRLAICVDRYEPFEVPDAAPTPTHPLETLVLSRPRSGLQAEHDSSIEGDIGRLVSVLFPYADCVESGSRWLAAMEEAPDRFGAYCDCAEV